MTTQPTKKPGLFSHLVTALCWTAAVFSLALSLAWTMSWASWEIDLVANLGAQWLLIMLAILLMTLALRRWRAAGAVALACLLQLWPLMTMRAAWLPLPPPGAHPGPDTVRILHYNDSSRSDKKLIYDMMEHSGADLIHILAPPVYMQFDVIYKPGLEDKYAGKLVRGLQTVEQGAPALIGAAFVVSRWPIEKYDMAFAGPMAELLIAGVVKRPGGAFAFVATHPRSPRDNSRWHEGNAQVAALELVVRDMEARGYPVVVIGDFNSTPTGYRSRALSSETGLRRAKPLFLVDGTHPDRVQMGLNKSSPRVISGFWPLSIAIDDVMISPGVEVEAWTTLPFLRGEHKPILVELRIPKTSTRALEANPTSR